MAEEERNAPDEATGSSAIDDEAVAIVPANEQIIRDLIYTVRGTQVMIDSDLVMLYGVETRRLNENVKRNSSRFPEFFCFQVTREEYESLMSQIATSSFEGRHGGRRKLPFFSHSSSSCLWPSPENVFDQHSPVSRLSALRSAEVLASRAILARPWTVPKG